MDEAAEREFTQFVVRGAGRPHGGSARRPAVIGRRAGNEIGVQVADPDTGERPPARIVSLAGDRRGRRWLFLVDRSAVCAAPPAGLDHHRCHERPPSAR